MLFLVGLPLFFLEMVLGQYAGVSATKIYARLAPGLRGMGYGMITIPTIINFQYVVVMAYGLFYLFAGFQKELPWTTCGVDYAGDNCYSIKDGQGCNESFNETFYKLQCYPADKFCEEFDSTFVEEYPGMCVPNPDTGLTDPIPFREVNEGRVSASEEYWYKKVLNIAIENGHVDTTKNSWAKWGGVRWEIMGCLALAWIIICLTLIKGLASYGKVVYFTTLFPYVVLTIMLGYTATLDGFLEGVQFYIVPTDWSKVFDINVWNDAAGQIFYSLGVAVGSQLLLSSYNGFKTNAHRDALLIGLCNSLTSLYAGFTVFGVIGYIAQQKDADIESVVSDGPDLAFIVYPEAVALMAAAPFFSFLFFLMLILLAVSSACAQWEATVASFFDEFPKYRTKRALAMIVSCVIGFVCGISMCFDSGILMFTLMDNRCSNAILLLAFVELITVSWFYGADNILRHVKDMGMSIPRFMAAFWWFCWVIATPLLVFAVTILAWINFPGDSLLDYEFPVGVQFLGWCLELVAVVMTVVVAVYVTIKRARAGKTWSFVRAGPMMRPTKDWGPREDSGLPRGSWNAAFVLQE